MGKYRLPDYIENSNKVCEYGCGLDAHYQLLNGKWCCSDRYHKCPSKRKVQSKAQKKRDDLVECGKRLGLGNKFVRTIEYINNKYPTFSKIEEMRYKSKKKTIQVHCENHNCINSKEQGGWFTPTGRQLEKRIERIERDGLDGSCFYCSEECKNECPLFGLNPNYILNEHNGIIYTDEQYNTWRIKVLERENYKCQYCDKVANIVHHEKPQKTHPHLSVDPDNGIACCFDCHYKYGHKTGTECSTGNLANLICLETNSFFF